MKPISAHAPPSSHVAQTDAPHGDSIPFCPTGKEYDAGLCYAKCDAGYYGIGPVCWKYCPDGYTNDGAICRKDAIIVPKNSYGRGAGTPLTCGGDENKDGALCYPKCKVGYEGIGPVCWQLCPDGYTNTGLTCLRPVYSFEKSTYGRGVGTIPNLITGNCPEGKEKDAGLCYKLCDAGYYGVGPVCWQYCPDGFVNDGAFCRRPGDDFTKDSYGRGAGVALHACGIGLEKDGGLCYPVCQTGYDGIGPLCWQHCPEGYTNDGAICRKDAIIIPKESYGRGGGTTPNCDINNIDCSGNFEVYSSFRPQPWGYNFANWGSKDGVSTYDTATDFDTATLIRMFGSGVCQTGTNISDCVLKATARDWRTTALASALGGHCYGLAVTSQMFFAKLDKPAVYQPTAAKTYDMDTLAKVRAHIAELFVSQNLTQANGTPSGWITGKTPSQILDLIRTNLRDTPNDPYMMAIYNADENGKWISGHAVTPFAIENRGNNMYWVHIYDNNKPNVDRYIVVDTAKDTWLYGFGATNPADPEGAWTGNASTMSLQLRLTSEHVLGGWYCPFCDKPNPLNTVGGTDAVSTVTATTSGVQFTLSGGGDLLVQDAQNHSMGWDFSTKKTVNEISGANTRFIVGGVGGSLNTQISLPPQSPTLPYSITVSGDSLTHTTPVRLSMIGPGSALDVSDITLAPRQHLIMTFHPDGRLVTFNADSAGTFTPTITLANDANASGNGYLFDVSGITLGPSKMLTVSLDNDANALHFTDNVTHSNAYKIELLRITPQGLEQRFMTDKAVVSGGTDAAMNLGTWDGSNAMDFVLNGQTQTIENQVKKQFRIFLPVVSNM